VVRRRAFQNLETLNQLFTPEMHLIEVLAVEMRQAVVAARRQMPLRRPNPLQRNGCLAQVRNLCPAFDQVVGGVEAIVQRQPQG